MFLRYQMSAVDTTGAGDAFNAGLAMALACGASLEEAVQFAAVTGGLAVTKEGVIPSLPSRTEVLHLYRQRSLHPPHWLSADAIVPILRLLLAGKVIGCPTLS